MVKRHGEVVCFWALAFLHLTPIWAFRYLPTQDGPSHLANALIVKEFGGSAAGFEDTFELRLEPVPNWTSHILLAGLMHLVPPLIAEKLLASLYILGFAGAFRYFLGAFGDRCRALSWLGLLFVYNRCFWMGFHNYCLSLILVWLIVGYCARRRGEGASKWPMAVVLTFLFPLAYFTHLVGFFLSALGAFGATILMRPRSLLGPVLVGLAAVPSCFLTIDYFERTGFFEQGAARRLTRESRALLDGRGLERSVVEQLTAVDKELFEHHAGRTVYVLLFVVVLFSTYGLFALGETIDRLGWEAPMEATEVVDSPPTEPRAKPPAGWLFPFCFGLSALAFYLLVANDLGSADGVLPHGGYLKTRLALLPPLIWLACLREPIFTPARLILRALTALLLCVNLFLVTRTVDDGNRELASYVAGIDAVGRGHRILAIQDNAGGRLADPIRHAADYYCLGSDNLNLDNYEAVTPHFPVKYRPGMTRGNATNADILIFWRTRMPPGRAGWEEIFAEGPLRIHRRQD